jgi:hypothetical protein
MRVDINAAGDHVPPAGIDHFSGIFKRQVPADRGNRFTDQSNVARIRIRRGNNDAVRDYRIEPHLPLH